MKSKKILQTISRFPALLGKKALGLTHRASHSRGGILNRKSLIIALVVLVLLGPSVYLLSRRPKAAEAAWYNDNWLYRKAVAITNSGSAQTDFQIQITLNTAALITAGKMQSDCDDIRVTDINGKTLGYWIQSHPSTNACNQSSTKIWVKVPSTPTTGTTVYFYYGNPSVTQGSNGNNTFIYFDNFQSDTSSDYTVAGDQETWTISGGIATDDTSNTYTRWATNTNFSETDFKIQTYLRTNDNDWAGVVYHSDAGSNFYTCNYRPETNYVYIGENTHSGLGSGAFTSSIGTWYTLTARVLGSNHYCDIDGTQYATASDATLTSGRIGMYSGANSPVVNYEYIFMAKCASTEPSAGEAGNEEQSPGPVAHWKFDEGADNTCSGGTNDACDSTQNGNDGAKTGAVWQDEDMCVSGKCLYFDGDDTISYGDKFDNVFSNDFSVSLWFKEQAVPTDYIRYLVFKGDGGYPYFAIGITGSSNSPHQGKIEIRHNNDAGLGYSTNTYADNNWHHVIVTRNDSANQVKMYIDGVLDKTFGDITFVDSGGFNIGSSASPHRYFDGFIDEVKIYPYTRSAEQVRSDYATRSSVHGVSAVLGTSKDQGDFLSQGLVGYWKMDETSWDGTPDEVIDSSGNSNHGVGVGATSPPTTTAGKFGNGGDFDGAEDTITVTDDDSIEPPNITFSVWFKTSASKEHYFFTKSNDNYYFNMFSDGKVGFWINSVCTGWLQSTNAFNDGNWHHAVGTYNGSHKLIYVDGKLEASNYSCSGGDIGKGASSLYIGSRGAGYYWNGQLDEARIYNRALSPKEVRDLYSWAPGPVGYWNFDEKTETTVYDRSKNSNNGSNIDTPTWTQGKYGGGYDLDGSNDGVQIAETSDLKPPYSMTVMAWVNLDTYRGGSEWGSIIEGGGNLNNTTGWYLGFDTSSTLLFKHGDSSTWDQAEISQSNVDLNEWHHITGVFNANSTTTKLYIDGVLIDSDNEGNTGISYEAIGTRFGRLSYCCDASHDMDGTIDDVRIYNYARTAKQIVEDMNAGHPIGGSPIGSQWAYWKMDDVRGTTLYDSGPNSKHATLVSTPSFSANGKFGMSMSSDGSNKYAYVSGVAGSQPETITAWVKLNSTPSSLPYGIVLGSANNYSGPTGFDKLLRITTAAKAQFYTNDGAGHNATGTTTLQTGTWYHVAGTVDGDYVKVYVNGVEENSVSGSSTTTGSYTIVNFDDTNYNSYADPVDGYIDEVKIYNSALTEDEIKLDYNQGKATVLGAFSTDASGNASFSSDRSYCPPGDTTASCAPNAEWKFDEGTGGIAYDSSENGANGTITGTTVASGYHGKGRKIESDSDYINLGNPSSLQFDNGNFTMEGWVKSSGQSGDYGHILTCYSGGNNHWQIRMGTDQKILGYIRDSGSNSAIVTATNVCGVNQWCHFAFLRNGNTVELFINGVSQGTDNASSVGDIDNSNDIYVGVDKEGYNREFLGTVDHFLVYGYARTPAQIAWDYNRGKPVGHWKFDECQGGTAYDSSSFSNNGSINIGATAPQTTAGSCGVGNTAAAWYNGVDGKYNSSLNFDGADDKISITDPPGGELDFGTSDFTIGAWIKLSGSGDRTVVDKGNIYIITQVGYNLAVSDSKFGLAISDGTDGYEVDDVPQANTTLSNGVWYFVAASWDSSAQKVSYFLNGADDGNYTTSNVDSINNNSACFIGVKADSRYFSGQIDDVRIYNYALTTEQIKNLYNAGSAVYFAQ